MLATTLAACAPSPAREAAPVASGGETLAPRRESRTLVFISRSEIDNVVGLGGVGTGNGTTKRFFNATLTQLDDRGLPQPYLAEALPQLNTATWQVFPDGHMETTYRLKPNLTWHDGQPLSAEDFVFAHRVYMSPDLEKGSPRAPPQNQMEEITAPDDRTLLIRWRRPFPGADTIGEEFRPLPRHILEPILRLGEPAGFDNAPFWTTQFVGLGPYKIERWEPGSTIDGVAFDGYVLGRPRIDRVRIQFNSDPNAVVATLLAQGAHLVADTTLRFQSGVLLKQQWDASKGGSVYLSPFQVRYAQVQLRPELANPRAILDVRARRALAHATDKQSLIDGLFEGQGIIADTLLPRNADQYATVERAITKYAYDPRRVEQLLGELGFTKDGEGFYTSPTEGRFAPEWRATSGGDSETQLAILVDGLRRSGIDARSFIFPQIQDDDRQARASFPTASNTSTTGTVDRWFRGLAPDQAPTAANFWAGSNRGGWSNAEYGRLSSAFDGMLDRDERDRTVAQMLRLVSEEVGVIPLYYNLDVIAHVAALRAPRLVSPDASIGWNLHEWELTS
jgi:peptide/nickel transport system substrate-binding protein